jgi:Asp-tRNA(Asn)/Glu-tRNA(Gln) amidotransferase A subunit family amidase
VRKLDEAGAINLGKLSMHEFGLGTSLDFSSWRLTLPSLRP